MNEFLKCIRTWMQTEKDDSNLYVDVGLKFSVKFLITLKDNGDTGDSHPVLIDTFDFLLGTVSTKQSVRFRLCQFVNSLLNSMSSEAVLDDGVCNSIIKYMLDRMKDSCSQVRVQAVKALQRLQYPDDPNDKIVRTYLFHLSHDMSSDVRMAILTAIGRNYRTIPPIMERLWDVDERVRRHTFIHMSSYSVKSYKVAQRVTFLEQGLNDHSEKVRDIVASVFLPQWLETYQKNYISFVAALKLDASMTEITRSMKVAKEALFRIFR